MNRTILGIDPGTGRCGWAVIKQDKTPELVDCGCIETKANTHLSDRLELIFLTLDKLIKNHKVDQMAVEELFFVKNIKTGISVAQARGVILLAGKLNKIEVFEYKPNEVKLAITGYGHAKKEQIIRMLPLHIKGCKLEQDDTADAVAIALYHLQNKKLG